MAVDTPHPDYKARVGDWRKIRDVLAGERRMREGRTDYVRKAEGMTDPEFSGYVNAASFFEATGRTLEGLTGLAFYRPPQIQVPEAMQPFVKDATQDGVPLVKFMEAAFEEVAAQARVGILVDFPPRDPAIRNLREEEAAGLRPFVSRYQAEDILNWRTARVRGAVALVEARLMEVESEELPDFKVRARRRIRVLELVKTKREGGGVDWRYQQRLFVEPTWTNEDGEATPTEPGSALAPTEEFVYSETIEPTMPGERPLDFIPFWIINPTDQSPAVRRPPMLGLANLNVTHFNTTAMLENALFWSANPQPWVAGVDPENAQALTIGSSRAWLFKDPTAKAEMLTAGTEGTVSLEKRLDRLEQQMAIMGARMLAADKKQVEAADTARIHRQGEISVIAGIVQSVATAFSDILRVVRDWAGAGTGEASVTMTTDFFDQTITVDDVLGAVKLWQQGLLHIDDLVEFTKRASLARSDRTVDQIVAGNRNSPIQPIIAGLTDSSAGLGAPPEPDPAPKQRPVLSPRPAPAPAGA